MGLFRLVMQTVARFFISAVFLAGAVKNILNWHETETDLMTVLSDWQSYIGFSQEAQIFFSQLISWSSVLLLLATTFMLLGGLFILLGIKQKLGTLLLISFLIPATILYHPFWWVDGSAHEIQTIMFLKNLSILGCLFQTFLHSDMTVKDYVDEEDLPSMRY